MSYCNGNESHTRNKQRRIRCLQSCSKTHSNCGNKLFVWYHFPVDTSYGHSYYLPSGVHDWAWRLPDETYSRNHLLFHGGVCGWVVERVFSILQISLQLSVNYPLNWYNNSIHPCNCHQAGAVSQNEFLRIYFSWIRCQHENCSFHKHFFKQHWKQLETIYEL